MSQAALQPTRGVLRKSDSHLFYTAETFDRKGLTRRERADRVRGKPGYFEKYGKSARHVLDVVLTRFSANGYMTLDDVLDQSRLVYFLRSLPHNTLGRPSKLVRAFGGEIRFDEAMRELQDLLYQD